MSTSQLIGEFMGNEGGANSNFLSTGFMNAGYFGLYLYCAIVGVLFKLVDSLSSRSLPVILSVSLTIVPIYALIVVADLPTALFTHGLVISLILLYLFRSSSFARRILKHP